MSWSNMPSALVRSGGRRGGVCRRGFRLGGRCVSWPVAALPGRRAGRTGRGGGRTGSGSLDGSRCGGGRSVGSGDGWRRGRGGPDDGPRRPRWGPRRYRCRRARRDCRRRRSGHEGTLVAPCRSAESGGRRAREQGTETGHGQAVHPDRDHQRRDDQNGIGGGERAEGPHDPPDRPSTTAGGVDEDRSGGTRLTAHALPFVGSAQFCHRRRRTDEALGSDVQQPSHRT